MCAKTPSLTARDFREVKDGLHAVAEQCWRNFLSAFNLTSILTTLRPAVRPTHAYYGGALFVSSRQQIQSKPRHLYQAGDRLVAAGDGRCHKGELDWRRLYAKREHHPRTVEFDTALEGGKHTQAQAFERSHHMLFGSMGLRPPYKFDWCSAFMLSHDCFGSPCHAHGQLRRNRTAASVVSGTSRRRNRVESSTTKSSSSSGRKVVETRRDDRSTSSVEASHRGGSDVKRPHWYLLPYRGHHKRFARRQELVLESAWQRRLIGVFQINATLRPWHVTQRLHDQAFDVSLPRMVMWVKGHRDVEHVLRRLAVVAPAWWVPGRQACGFTLDHGCTSYNGLNNRRWNRTQRAAAARQGTVQKSHSLDLIRDIL